MQQALATKTDEQEFPSISIPNIQLLCVDCAREVKAKFPKDAPPQTPANDTFEVHDDEEQKQTMAQMLELQLKHRFAEILTLPGWLEEVINTLKTRTASGDAGQVTELKRIVDDAMGECLGLYIWLPPGMLCRP